MQHEDSRMKPVAASPTQEALAGLVERVTFHDAENGFCVLRTKARGHRNLVTVVGHSATIVAGEWTMRPVCPDCGALNDRHFSRCQ